MKLLRAIWQRATAAYALARYNAYPSDASIDTSPSPITPPITIEMKQRGTTWAKRADGGWREVCDTCGQCGMTERLGNPGFSLDRIIAKTGMNNPVAGLPLP
jgi:hypothetical protein